MRNSKKTERFTAFSKYERRLIFLPVAFLLVSGAFRLSQELYLELWSMGLTSFSGKGEVKFSKKVRIFLEREVYGAAKAQSKVPNSGNRGLR
jgi:hypothetical protein